MQSGMCLGNLRHLAAQLGDARLEAFKVVFEFVGTHDASDFDAVSRKLFVQMYAFHNLTKIDAGFGDRKAMNHWIG